ncbi:unnamed protein product [Schistosoma mattheei]|uniref:Uncharacterized protein n=1 Tax=Schistosoma mattheei TaxID=31246 RepID=A0A183PE34_9TREM|nr:unnamed protein product [Schistosoma mattheei]
MEFIFKSQSCSNEDRNHVFQSFSPSVITTTNSTPSNYPPNNNSMISSILNNGNIHLNQIKCNDKSTCTEVSTNSPRQVLSEIKEGLFKTKLIDEKFRMNSYCNDQLITSSNNLLSSDSVYLPLSNTTNNIEETFETEYKAKSHSNAVHCTISDVNNWKSIDKKSLKLSPSDSLISSGNFIPLHHNNNDNNVDNNDNSNNNIDEKDILVKGVLDDMDLTCLINLKHKISTQSIKVHNSVTKDQENEIFDNNIKQ